jgi:hypothetical protein
MRETAGSFKRAPKDPCLISDIKECGIFFICVTQSKINSLPGGDTQFNHP